MQNSKCSTLFFTFFGLWLFLLFAIWQMQTEMPMVITRKKMPPKIKYMRQIVSAFITTASLTDKVSFCQGIDQPSLAETPNTKNQNQPLTCLSNMIYVVVRSTHPLKALIVFLPNKLESESCLTFPSSYHRCTEKNRDEGGSSMHNLKSQTEKAFKVEGTTEKRCCFEG